MNATPRLFRIVIIASAVWSLSGPFTNARAQYGRDTLRIVGSSTVYPFAQTVAAFFSEKTAFKVPVIESTGSGGGFHLFCAGVGVEHPDIVNASRRINPEEFNTCMANGVEQISEIMIGYDGIVVANSIHSTPFHLSRKDLFLALAKTVPDPKNLGAFVANPYRSWRGVNPMLPDIPIRVYGPSSTSGTRDAFIKLAMEGGADQIKEMDGSRNRQDQTLRDDGAYIEEGENDDVIVYKLSRHPDALGIFGFSFLDKNTDKLQGSLIDGVSPSAVTIASGHYPLSRPLYLYVKCAHADRIPGLRTYLQTFTAEKMWGPGGKLAKKGLVPMTDEERTRNLKVSRQLPILEMDNGRLYESTVR